MANKGTHTPRNENYDMQRGLGAGLPDASPQLGSNPGMPLVRSGQGDIGGRGTPAPAQRNQKPKGRSSPRPGPAR